MPKQQLPKYRRIMAIFAHPDDEAFGPGGTLALLAKRSEVTLVCVTDGDNPTAKEPYASVRGGELRRAAKVLGLKEVIFLGYPDGGLCNANYHGVAKDIQRVVNQFKPEMLLTFEPRGVSGHLDHIAVSMICSYIFRDDPRIRQVWYFCELERKALRWFRDKYFVFFPEGYRVDEVDAVIETTAVYRTQVAAMKEHKSQRADCDRILLARKFLPKEEYFLVKKR